MEAIKEFRTAAERFNNNPQDADARSALAKACQGLKVLHCREDGLINIEESADALAFALQTHQDGEAGAMTAEQLCAQLLPQIEADPRTGAPLRRGKTTRDPIVDWTPVSLEERRVVAYGVERGETLGTSEQIVHQLSGAGRDLPPWPRLRKELKDLDSKATRTPSEDRLLLRTRERLYFRSGAEAPAAQEHRAGSTREPFDSADRAAVRRELGRRLRLDTDFMAFCLDNFPGTYRRFSGGMDRITKESLLLQNEDLAAISAALSNY